MNNNSQIGMLALQSQGQWTIHVDEVKNKGAWWYGITLCYSIVRMQFVVKKLAFLKNMLSLFESAEEVGMSCRLGSILNSNLFVSLEEGRIIFWIESRDDKTVFPELLEVIVSDDERNDLIEILRKLNIELMEEEW